jgi:hypothetical protein
MTEKTIVFLTGGAILAGLFLVLTYSVALQKKAVGTQDTTMPKFDESLALSRESIQLQREALRIAEESLTLQREELRLLAKIVKEPPSA